MVRPPEHPVHRGVHERFVLPKCFHWCDNRNEESEKVNLEAQQRIGQLEFNLTEATKTCQVAAL